MVRGKVQYEQCFEAANQGTPLRNPRSRTPRYDENSDVVIAKLELFWGGSGYTLSPWSGDYLLASRHPR